MKFSGLGEHFAGDGAESRRVLYQARAAGAFVAHGLCKRAR
jgi:hypothetical protein